MGTKASFGLLLSLAVLGACSDSPTDPPPGGTAVPVSTVVVSPDSARVTTGDTVRLSATLRDAAGGTLSGRVVAWTSTDTSIATVSSTGAVRGVGVGPVTIIATSEQKSDTARITVAPRAELALAVGATHSCALDETGTAHCWGGNASGQLGNGTNTNSLVPVPVAGGFRFTSISAGRNTTCALTPQGSAYCWGANNFGALGNGSTAESNTPVPVSGNLRFSSISVGGFNYACGLTTTGSAHCWGSNRQGGLGTGDTASVTTPAAVSGGLTFRSISAGVGHTCAVTTGGDAYCWGLNSIRQIDGLRTEPRVLVPVRAATDLPLSSLHAGVGSTCGIAGADAYCWGRGFFGSKGDGSTSSASSAPTRVVGGLRFASVRPGNENNTLSPVCGLTTGGAAYCWGANRSGQLGTTASLPDTCTAGATLTFACTGTPVFVAGGLTFEAVVPGGDHTCGITRDARVYCWGANDAGQLGDGTTGQRNTPVGVTGGIRFP